MSHNLNDSGPLNHSRDYPGNVVYLHDLNGNLTFLNRLGEEVLGYSCEEALQMNISEIVAPEIEPQVRKQILASTNRRIGTVYELEVVAKDGHRVTLEVSMSVISRDGGAVEIEGIAVPSRSQGEARDRIVI